jgi:hypothetical protein
MIRPYRPRQNPTRAIPNIASNTVTQPASLSLPRDSQDENSAVIGQGWVGSFGASRGSSISTCSPFSGGPPALEWAPGEPFLQIFVDVNLQHVFIYEELSR